MPQFNSTKDEYDWIPEFTSDNCNYSGNKNSTPSNFQFFSSWRSMIQIFVLFVCLSCLSIYCMIGSQANDTIMIKTIQQSPSSDAFESIQLMQQQLLLAQDEFHEVLKIKYGIYYDDIFWVHTKNKKNGTIGGQDDVQSRGRYFFKPGSDSTISRLRLQNKLTVKILEGFRMNPNHRNSSNEAREYVPLVWATGGHSSAAGHGNLFHESYTFILNQTLIPIFDAFNIQFIGRNYAMGSNTAAPENAFCIKEIYGMDVDILVWDYGITDTNKHVWKQVLYQYRASISLANTSRPIHFAYHADGNPERRSQVEMLEEMGLGALISDDHILDQALNAVPDSAGISEVEIQQLPEFVRNFRCGSQIENGDPYCKIEKFNLLICPDRKFMTNWHPGWKWHALKGYLTAFYMIEVMNDAVHDVLNRLKTSDAETILKEIQDIERIEHVQFQKSQLPKIITDKLPPDQIDGFDYKSFLRGQSYCHTAKLPSEIRYSGILTESIGKIGSLEFDKGVGLLEIQNTTIFENENKIAKGNPTIKLVYTESERNPCPILIKMDFKDFFYVGVNYGWQKLSLPNQMERLVYGNGDADSRLQGYVMLCFSLCDHECPKSAFDRSVFLTSQWLQIQINQVFVTDMYSFSNCEILRHQNGYKFPINRNNAIDIQAQIVVPDANVSSLLDNSHVRISSFIVW